MAIKKIVTVPDSILRKKSLVVEKADKEIKNLMDDMLETMYKAPGIGLAAVQIGIPKRIVVIDISKDENKKDPIYFVNPELTWKSKEKATYEEVQEVMSSSFNKEHVLEMKYNRAVVYPTDILHSAELKSEWFKEYPRIAQVLFL